MSYFVRMQRLATKHPLLAFLTALASAFGMGWGAHVSYQGLTEKVVLSQSQYVALSRPPQEQELESTRPQSLQIPADPYYGSTITVTSIGEVTALKQGGLKLRVLVNETPIVEGQSTRGAHVDDDRILVKVSNSFRLEAGEDGLVRVVAENPGTADTRDARYVLKISRTYNIDDHSSWFARLAWWR